MLASDAGRTDDEREQALPQPMHEEAACLKCCQMAMVQCAGFAAIPLHCRVQRSYRKLDSVPGLENKKVVSRQAPRGRIRRLHRVRRECSSQRNQRLGCHGGLGRACRRRRWFGGAQGQEGPPAARPYRGAPMRLPEQRLIDALVGFKAVQISVPVAGNFQLIAACPPVRALSRKQPLFGPLKLLACSTCCRPGCAPSRTSSVRWWRGCAVAKMST